MISAVNVIKSSFKKVLPAIKSKTVIGKLAPLKEDVAQFTACANSGMKLTFFPNDAKYTYYRDFQKIIRSLADNEKILARDCGINPFYTIDRAILSDKGYTDNICDCFAILLHNGKRGCLTHICPRNYEKPHEIKTLYEFMNKYITIISSRTDKPIEALIVGGIPCCSEKLLKILDDILSKSKKCNISKILNTHPRGGHSFYFNLPKKQIIIDGGVHENISNLKEEFNLFGLGC